MARKWHVKANGEMGICSAESGNCPFQSEGAVHFSNPEDAIARSEEIYEFQLGLFPEEDNSDAPSRDEFYEELSDIDYIGDHVDPGGYIVFHETMYQVTSFEETGTMDTKVNAVDMETGESRELYIGPPYSLNPVLLRGNGPLDRSDPSSYNVEWNESAYMGSYINPGDSFLYRDKVYRADDWEWSRALLRTEIEAYDESTGETETITIHQGSEPEVKFLKGTKYSY